LNKVFEEYWRWYKNQKDQKNEGYKLGWYEYHGEGDVEEEEEEGEEGGWEGRKGSLEKNGGSVNIDKQEESKQDEVKHIFIPSI